MSEPADVTPLDPDEADALRLSYIATRAELNAAEADNIATGVRWAARQHLAPGQILDDLFLRELHRQMFGVVWRWAGKYRRTEKNSVLIRQPSASPYVTLLPTPSCG